MAIPEEVLTPFERVRAYQARVQQDQMPGLASYQSRLDALRQQYIENKAQEEANKLLSQYAALFTDWAPIDTRPPGARAGSISAQMKALPSRPPVGAIQRFVADYAARKYGWTGREWDALRELIQRESGWNPYARNPRSTAFGLFQFLKATARNYGIPWGTTNYKVQTDAGLRYIRDRYGTPSKALAFWLRNRWY